MQTAKFPALRLPFHGKGATELWLVTRKVLLKQNQYQLPSESDAARRKGYKQNKTHLKAIAASQGALWWGSKTETVGEFLCVPTSGTPCSPCLGNSAWVNTLAPSPRGLFL